MSIITISRGSFSGGKAVAEELGKRLEQPVLSREQVLTEAARDYGISERELADSLNQPPPFWQQVLGKRLVYVRCVTAVLLEHARQGNLIYHGHMGHLLLAGVPHVLRVRVIADMEQRIAGAMRQIGLNREAALAHIQRVDRERARWANVLYGVDWNDPSQYDITLNLERISLVEAAEVLAGMTALAHFKPTPAGLQRQQDIHLASRVWASMARDPQTRNISLEVAAHRGEVVLRGNVGAQKTIEKIIIAARQVDGVTAVRSELGRGADWYW